MIMQSTQIKHDWQLRADVALQSIFIDFTQLRYLVGDKLAYRIMDSFKLTEFSQFNLIFVITWLADEIKVNV